MRPPPDDAVRLIAGLLSHIRDVVGDGASYAMFHYGAVEEGKRLAERLGASGERAAFQHLDRVLGQETEVVADAGDAVTLRVRSPLLVGMDSRAADGVLLGLVEGVLSGARRARFKGSILPRAPGEDVVLELRSAPA